MRTRSLLSAVFAALAGVASAQTTQTRTDTFDVTIDITRACTLDSASDISFGSVPPSPGPHNANGNVQVSCSTGTPYSLGLNYGINADVSNRHMVHASIATALIPYTLSSIAAGGSAWGNEAASWVTGVGQGTGTSISHPVYAQATLTGNEPPGTYSDTVTATLTF